MRSVTAALLSLCLLLSPLLAACGSMNNLTLRSRVDDKKLVGRLSYTSNIMAVGLDEESYTGKATEVAATTDSAAPAGARQFSVRLKAYSGRSMRCEYTLLPGGGGKGECFSGTISYDLLID